MKTYLFMNEKVRDPKPSGPVIVAQRGGRRRVADTFVLELDGRVIGKIKFRARGLVEVISHRVVAWVELEEGVTVR